MNSQAEDQEQLSGYENEVPFHENAFAFSPDFPIIRNLSDVLPHIRPDSGIKSHVWADRFVGMPLQNAGQLTLDQIPPPALLRQNIADL